MRRIPLVEIDEQEYELLCPIMKFIGVQSMRSGEPEPEE
jgi:hypothetical protein